MQAAAFLIALVLAGAAAAQPPCDVRCEARKRMFAHPARQEAFWRNALRAPVEARIGIGGPELVEYLTLDAIKNDFPDRPRIAQPPPGFMDDLKAAFRDIPAPVKAMVASRLAGIYLVDNIGSTGFTDAIVDAGGRQVAGFIVLDSTALADRTANAWATWRESTPFKPSATTTLRATIEPDASDTRAAAIQYILLHELAHVLSIDNDIHPPWGVRREQPKPGAYRYFDLSWAVRDEKYVTRFDDAFAARNDVVYYFGPRIGADSAADTYRSLQATNFVTLYGSTHPADDFAEAFASYVHTQLMRKPFEIAITREGEAPYVFRACWSEPRCADKKRWFDDYFARARPR